MIPKPQTVQSFSELTKDFLLTSSVYETNFHLLYASLGCSDKKIREVIGNAPRRITTLLPEIQKLVLNTMGNNWFKYADRIVITKRLSIMGFPQPDDDNIFAIKVHDYEDDITKFVFEFQQKQIVDPLISIIAKTIFDDHDFVPTMDTEVTMDVAKVSLKILYDRKPNNFIYNMHQLDNEVHLHSFKKGNKKYDVLKQTVTSILQFGEKISTRDAYLSAPIDFSIV